MKLKLLLLVAGFAVLFMGIGFVTCAGIGLIVFGGGTIPIVRGPNARCPDCNREFFIGGIGKMNWWEKADLPRHRCPFCGEFNDVLTYQVFGGFEHAPPENRVENVLVPDL
jgi:hypothetical protein